MLSSIHLSALELGIGFQEYEEISRNIGRVKSIPLGTRQRILDTANKELSPRTISLGLELIKNLASIRRVYDFAGLVYSEGPPEGEGLFTTAVADYLLRSPKLCHKTL